MVGNTKMTLRDRESDVPLHIMKAVMLIAVFVTCFGTSNAAWIMADLSLGIMTWMNMIALVLLYRPVMRVLRDYEEQIKLGGKLTFNPRKLNIKNAHYWESIAEEDDEDSKTDAS